MARIEPDSIHGTVTPLQDGERLVAEFRADRATYWRGHLILAVVLGAAAGLFLMWQGNPYPVAGPFGAVLAIGARAAYLASEALAETWRLTDRRLLGPGGRTIPRAQIRAARPFLGAVQITTTTGDRHLIKYLADPAATAARITGGRR
ncbi:hypothetical protein [Tabrizicola sp.]|uniref:hypothetical protein n=1 Tax=Tabrizicola sp. TaxID=2005166 RepID=UPI0027366D98|nr:hypothetical protein [Tabrizicola sp.]MDP3195488.1 hypothetical protein [Tabrizicola sp.]MDZ4065712.1 hypothetical protein [Tabrizicola sp.]